MKKIFWILLLAAASMPAAAQGERSRTHRETAPEASQAPRERVEKERGSVFHLNRKDLELFERGEAVRLSVRTEGADRSLAFRWVSDDPGVARVDEKGVVTPRSLGRTQVRAIAPDGRRTNDCDVTVSKPRHWGSVNGTDRLVVQNEWVYFANPADGDRLYKVHVSGQKLVRLSDDVPANLNVTGRRIYYYNTNRETKNGTYAISVDGEGRALLNDRDGIGYLRVNKHGWAFYLNESGEVFSMRTNRPNEPVQKLFDDKPVYSIAVNDFHIFYNRHWEDIPQPHGAGGVLSYSLKSKKKTGHLSVNVNTSPLILDQSDDAAAYYCSYGNHADVTLLPGIFKDSPATGWFKVVTLDEGKDSLPAMNTQPGSRGGMPTMKSLISRMKLISGDRVRWVADGWVYYSRDRELRRMQVDGKRDQGVTTAPADVAGWYYGGDYLFFLTEDNRLFRTLGDGRNTVEIGCRP